MASVGTTVKRERGSGLGEEDVDESRISNRQLYYIAAALAYTVAGIHLFYPSLGMPALVAYTAAGTPLIDPRPLAFVLSGVAIIIGINVAVLGIARRQIYVAGVALMAIYLVGYFMWHAFGHGAWWPLGPERPWVSHSFLGILLDSHHLHPRNDPVPLISKGAELALLVVLTLLYFRESTD